MLISIVKFPLPLSPFHVLGMRLLKSAEKLDGHYLLVTSTTDPNNLKRPSESSKSGNLTPFVTPLHFDYVQNPFFGNSCETYLECCLHHY